MSEPRDPLLGREAGRYRIVRAIGEAAARRRTACKHTTPVELPRFGVDQLVRDLPKRTADTVTFEPIEDRC